MGGPTTAWAMKVNGRLRCCRTLAVGVSPGHRDAFDAPLVRICQIDGHAHTLELPSSAHREEGNSFGKTSLIGLRTWVCAVAGQCQYGLRRHHRDKGLRP